MYSTRNLSQALSSLQVTINNDLYQYRGDGDGDEQGVAQRYKDNAGRAYPSSLKITISNDMCRGGSDGAGDHNAQSKPLNGSSNCDVGEMGQSEAHFESLAEQIHRAFVSIHTKIELASDAIKVEGDLAKMRAESSMTNLDFLTKAQVDRIFGPASRSSQLLVPVVDTFDPKSGVATKQRVQDWASLPRFLIHHEDPKYQDYENCLTEAGKVEYLHRRGVEPLTPEQQKPPTSGW